MKRHSPYFGICRSKSQTPSVESTSASTMSLLRPNFHSLTQNTEIMCISVSYDDPAYVFSRKNLIIRKLDNFSVFGVV